MMRLLRYRAPLSCTVLLLVIPGFGTAGDGGAAEVAAASTTSTAMGSQSAAGDGGPGPVDLGNGERIYREVCLPCHGEDGQGGPGGGAPLTSMLTRVDITTIVRDGRNAMPEFGSMLSRDDLHDISSFVLEKLLSN